MKYSNEEGFLKDVIVKSQMKNPFPGLENDIMIQIEKEEIQQKAFRRGLAYSWVFFIAGAIFGMILFALIPQMDISFAGIDADPFLIFFQVGVCIFLLLHLEKLLVYTKSAQKRILSGDL